MTGTPITLLENLRALFYAPFYLAFERDYFGQEGVSVQMQESFDPTDTLPRLLSGEIDVCWGGPLRVLRAYDKNPDVDLVCFGEVVGRDPFFLVGQEPGSLADLPGKRIAVVSEVPTPWICLGQDLRDQGIDPASLGVMQKPGMDANRDALAAGELDVFQAFQPYAEQALQAGGHLLYAAATRGPTAYTSFYALKPTVERRRDDFRAMVRAVRRAVAEAYDAPAEETATALSRLFPDFTPDVVAACIRRYQGLGLWNRSGAMPEAGFERLRQSMIGAGFIKHGTDFATAVDNTLAE
jgi:NitT/TauT family transport system substrate-binding protein